MHNGHEKDGTPRGKVPADLFSLCASDAEKGEREESLDAPPKLLSALRQLPKEPVFVPRTIDDALLKAARQHLAPPQRKNIRWLRLLPWSVATAGFAAAVLLAYPYSKDYFGYGRSTFGRSSRSILHGSQNADQTVIYPQNHASTYARGDLNHDGKVDILDALILAKKLQAVPFNDPTLDLNTDGVLDHRDVEVIAVQAVSLEKRGRS